MSLNTEMKSDGIHVTDKDGKPVALIAYQTHRPAQPWLVTFCEGFEHGTGTMWWRSLKAAEYHVLAVHTEHTDERA